ncbi:hypothetical protein MTO96_052174 [Rhipicephalus appendiculatus]
MALLASPSYKMPTEQDGLRNSNVSIVTEGGIVKSTVENAVIPDVDLPTFLREVWRRNKDQTALVDAQSGAEYTFGQLLEDCGRVAAALCKLGLRIGDVVGFHCVNSYELTIAMCGTFFAGGAAVLLKTNLTQGEVHDQLYETQPSFVVCDLKDAEKVKNASEGVSSVKTVIVTTGACEGTLGLSELIQSSVGDVNVPLNLNPDRLLVIIYSSGSAGPPKGVLITHRNIIAQVTSYR